MCSIPTNRDRLCLCGYFFEMIFFSSRKGRKILKPFLRSIVTAIFKRDNMGAAIFNRSFNKTEVKNFRTPGVAVLTVARWVMRFLIALF